MVVWEVFFSAFLQVLFDIMVSCKLLNFLRQCIEKKLVKWSKMRSTIQAVLSDAEEKQTTNKATKLWLQDLRVLSYDIEDKVDELASEALRCKLMSKRQDAPRSRSRVDYSIRTTENLKAWR